jgi:hypothetical protein
MTDTYRDWPEKLPLALWGYRTSIRTSTGATRMEAVLPPWAREAEEKRGWNKLK